jgi:hypothetical protein
MVTPLGHVTSAAHPADTGSDHSAGALISRKVAVGGFGFDVLVF